MSGIIKDLWTSRGNSMPPTHHAEIAARLDRLVQQAKLQLLGPHQPKGPGRPSQGIRAEYVRTEIYLSPDVRDAIDRLADRRETRTGHSTSRADVVREALAAYVRAHLPEAGL
jgi:hypothetical protein